MTNGKDIKQALKTIGASNTFWGWDDHRNKVHGINYWIADGVLTFEGGDGTTADVTVGKDFQICGFLDKVALTLLRQLDNTTCVELVLEDNCITFRECHERMTLNNRFKLYEPLADNYPLMEAA